MHRYNSNSTLTFELQLVAVSEREADDRSLGDVVGRIAVGPDSASLVEK